MHARLLKPACWILSVFAFQTAAIALEAQPETALHSGIWAYRKHDYARACSQLQAALSGDPEIAQSEEQRANALYQLALAQEKMKILDQAKANLAQCLQIRAKLLRPTSPDIV